MTVLPFIMFCYIFLEKLTTKIVAYGNNGFLSAYSCFLLLASGFPLYYPHALSEQSDPPQLF